MISTSLLHPSHPATLGELRLLTAHLPDSTPLAMEALGGDFVAPAAWLESDEAQPTLIFSEPL